VESVDHLLGGQLHDLAAEVYYPDDLVLFREVPLAQFQHPLIEVTHQLPLEEHFIEVLHFYAPDPVHHHNVPVLVAAADAVVVDFFDLPDALGVEVVLGERKSTSYCLLKERKEWRQSCLLVF
jgi:hypothetical protein